MEPWSWLPGMVRLGGLACKCSPEVPRDPAHMCLKAQGKGQRHSWREQLMPARRCCHAQQTGPHRACKSAMAPLSLPLSNQPAIRPHWKGSTLPLDCACRTSTMRRGSSAWSRGPLQSTDGHAGIPCRRKRATVIDHPLVQLAGTCWHAHTAARARSADSMMCSSAAHQLVQLALGMPCW